MRRSAPIVVLIVVAGVLTTFIAQNVKLAWNRTAQKRTMADIRSIATAWEARATRTNSYAVGSDMTLAKCSRTCSGTGLRRSVRFSDLERVLVPTYIRKLPATDGWGNQLDFRVGDFIGDAVAQSYRIRSTGSDGEFDNNTDSYLSRTIARFEEDVVFADGTFLQYPEGT